MSEAPIVVRVGAASDTGLRRRVNEDAFLADAPLFLVADGMGGHDAGDRASAAVVAEFARLVGAQSLGIDEMRAATTSERQGRVIDQDPSASMEKKKREGYF